MILTDAIEYYSNRFKFIDVPYIVDAEVSEITKPNHAEDLYHNDKVYVASGEQSFIQLIKESKLNNGLSMCLTPCYRDEELIDDLHLKIFMKIELIDYCSKWDDYQTFMNEHLVSLSKMIDIARSFFTKVIPYPYNMNIETVVSGHLQYDILVNGIEVGSYGVRETKYGRFIYGTGLALPRFNQALEVNNVK